MDILFPYGRATQSVTTTTDNGTITKTTTHSVHNFAKLGEEMSYTERIKVDDHKDIISEALKYCDKYKNGDRKEPSFKIRERGGKPAFVEITWTPKT